MRRTCQYSLLVLASLVLACGCRPGEKIAPLEPSTEAVDRESVKSETPMADATAATDKPTTEAQASPDQDLPEPIEVTLVKMGPVEAVVGADEPVEPIQFAENAFPPTLSDTDWHRDGWLDIDCLRCHETAVDKAPRVRHQGMPEVLLAVKCRSCHVLIPGQGAEEVIIEQEESSLFNQDAFPPMLPNSSAHLDSWTQKDCLLCHEDGIKGAPVVKHQSQHLPRLLLKVKCRTCHVQVRAID